ncbi:MAG: molybdopterin-binding protein, partial [Actinomycetota bacterium]|nr:molybdopterin-binding protein [Actinomycetota bacterium]
DAPDTAGRALMDEIDARGWIVIAYHVCPDEIECIATSIIEIAEAEDADIIFTLGGTSVGPRDVTPDATELVCERMVPGIAEVIRSCCSVTDTSFSLSRAVAGLRGSTLVINLPGGDEPSMKGFMTIADHLEAAVSRLRGSGAD